MSRRHGDAATTLAKLPDGSVDCIVTSPPYFGLRDYGVDGQIGAEATPGQFVASLVDVFHEARRVLADDGTCGSTWATRTSTRAVLARRGRPGSASRTFTAEGRPPRGDLPAKNLLGIPWRVIRTPGRRVDPPERHHLGQA